MMRALLRKFDQWRAHPKAEMGGLVRIAGAFLLDHEADVMNLVRHEGKLAEEKDAKHRITKVEKVDGGIVVETSEHNLALRIGKALFHAYKGEHEYKFSKGEKFVEVDWKRD